ncbi:ATP-binding protein [Ectopseudomonas hydrolytica]|uniref:ATP-binding protein n=1 Tax=Ectopseudomonas hydrolytica TaxID=2493633 RepID=UPI003EDEF7FE
MRKARVIVRKVRIRLTSLRLRLMLASAALAMLFMLLLMPVLQGVFLMALEETVEKRLASDAAALISAARIQEGQLHMPDKMPDEEFDNLDSHLLGFIFDREGRLIWRSRSSLDELVNYKPRYDGRGHEFVRIRDESGQEYFVYDIEVDLLRGNETALSIVTMQPTREYQRLFDGFAWQLRLWLGLALLVLLGLLWFGLTWGFRSLRGLSDELDGVESGTRQRLSDDHPRELLRLTNSLNRLLDSERRQRERYRDSLEDLAHSLKTPLSVLQGIGETLSVQPENREQAQLMQAQIERMSQQVGYQLQRASLRRSGLVRHRERVWPLLDGLCRSLDKVYRDKRVEAMLEVPEHSQISMERGALMELLGNLLENAYRLCLHRVRVSLQPLPDGCLLTIEDDGPGVPHDQRSRVLQRGERLDAQNPGQGIGLAVVEDIVESYEGELSLEDSELGGACFKVRLYD